MESLQTIIQIVPPEDWMLSEALQDAYLHVPILLPSFHKYLRFAVGLIYLQFCCLLFGLCTYLRTFTKVLIVALGSLRERGLWVCHYLDIVLLLACSREQLLIHREF